jgi:hypothetical protein
MIRDRLVNESEYAKGLYAHNPDSFLRLIGEILGHRDRLAGDSSSFVRGMDDSPETEELLLRKRRQASGYGKKSLPPETGIRFTFNGR